jgi:hypothetical protein
MTLTKTLRIDESLLGIEVREAMSVGERIWRHRGTPRESVALADVLEEIMTTCQRSGLRYPAVLLLRKKQIQRGQFFLEPPKAADGRCQLCGGSGYYLTAAGTGSLCGCGSWRKQKNA